MTMAVLYVHAGGRMVGEMRGGVATDYLSDSLGSLIGTVSGGAVTYSADYYPYGELASSTGANVSPWGFVGLLGYFTDQLQRLYVRARHLRVDLGAWITVDPLWPGEIAYTYAQSNPIRFSDASGELAIGRRPFPVCVCGAYPKKTPTVLYGGHPNAGTCLGKACQAFCDALFPALDEASSECQFGNCGAQNKKLGLNSCASAQNWRLCGEYITELNSAAGGPAANQNNYPAPIPQINSHCCSLFDNVGGEYCCMECRMRTCCNALAENTYSTLTAAFRTCSKHKS